MSEQVEPETFVYMHGLIHLSVCSNDPLRYRILATVNSRHPTGLEHGWTFSEDETFSGGEPNPSPCNQYPETHTHYLLDC